MSEGQCAMDETEDRTTFLRLASGGDLLTLMKQSPDGICLDEATVSPLFFDLRTGIAGDVLQKCANHGYRLAIVVADPARYGERFVELTREHRQHDRVRFPRTRAHGETWLKVR